jgi:hypothetical protein
LSHGDLCVLTAMDPATFEGLWSGLCGVGLWSFVSTQLVHAGVVARLRSVSAMISDEILTNSNETEDALLIGLLSKIMAKRRDHGVPPVDRRSAIEEVHRVGSPLK